MWSQAREIASGDTVIVWLVRVYQNCIWHLLEVRDLLSDSGTAAAFDYRTGKRFQ
jgi:hypothetical protein